jgi:hypothetical protein
MSTTVRQILNSFEALSAEDKHEAALEILRRYPGSVDGDLPDSALTELADQLFQTLDTKEAANGPR